MRLTTIRQKILCVALVLLMPAALFLLAALSLRKGPIDDAKLQMSGMEHQKGLRTLLEALAETRSVWALGVEKERDVISVWKKSQAEVGRALTLITALEQRHPEILGPEQSIQSVKTLWDKLLETSENFGPGMPATPEMFDGLDQLSDEVMSLARRTSRTTTRSLPIGVPNLAAQQNLLDLLEAGLRLAQARAAAAQLPPPAATPNPASSSPSAASTAAKSKLSMAGAELAKTSVQAQAALISLRTSAQEVLESREGANALAPALTRLTRSMSEDGAGDAFLASLRSGDASRQERARLGNEAVQASFQAYDALHRALSEHLIEFGGQERLVLIGWAAGGLAILLFLGAPPAYVIARPMLRQTRKLVESLDNIGRGRFESRVEMVSEDELGRVAFSINSMLNHFDSLIHSQSERDDIQQAIQKLMSEVADVASGDLTVEAEVTNDFTGSLADAINFMISQLRAIVSNVQAATLHVSASANDIHITTEYLSRGGDAQATQILETSRAIDEVAGSIQRVAESATQSLTVAEQARDNAKRGTEAVRDTINGMDRIRDQVQETAKRIKRLGESSQEIGDIVKLIGDIADRTSILALNASIQAAMAGEAGRGFAVVAEEVERLSERSNEATRKIASLIKTIQTTTAEAVAAMEESTREVVEGSNLALTAGYALTEIDLVSNKLAEIIQSIAFAVRQQARGSEALSKSMAQISEVTQQTAAGTREAASSVSNLAKLADDLRSSVSTFKLPFSDKLPPAPSRTANSALTAVSVSPIGNSTAAAVAVSNDASPPSAVIGRTRNSFTGLGTDSSTRSQFNQRVSLIR